MPLPTSQLEYPLEFWVSLHFTRSFMCSKLVITWFQLHLKGTTDKTLHYIWSFQLFIQALNVSEREKRKYETVHCCFYSDQSHLNVDHTAITTFKLASRNFPGGLYNVTSSYVTVKEMKNRVWMLIHVSVDHLLSYICLQLWPHMASGWVFNQHTA